MKRSLAVIAVSALLIAGCGSDNDDTSTGTGEETTTGEGEGEGTGEGEGEGEGTGEGEGEGEGTGEGTSEGTGEGEGTAETDRSALFDSATAATGRDPLAQVCPADTAAADSDTGWVNTGNSWCVYKCPADAALADNPGDWGYDTNTDATCRNTTEVAGTVVNAPIYPAPAPFTQIYVTSTASTSDFGGNYTCQLMKTEKIDDVDTWVEDSSRAAYQITLNADGSAGVWSNIPNDANAFSTFSFADGALTIENYNFDTAGTPMSNVAVGTGSFTNWNSKNSITRCTLQG